MEFFSSINADELNLYNLRNLIVFEILFNIHNSPRE